ncbi:MAG: hypothetical protein HKN67_00685 [Saprospiraceae bacterium]|nr:hypothetical protein [Bacteroidia bacterium]MBT8230939.1 hypothetical protein [Bacteroidia bacterium]NNF20429.1 hypothetical protein [Saprospiraceae bacterium]
MKIRKSWLFSFVMAAFLTTTAFSASTYDEGPNSVNKQFQKLLKGLKFENIENSQTVYVDFMINEKSEIIVLSTNSKDMDNSLKSRLNYKTLEAENLDLFTRYTVPISFKK